MAIRKIDLMHRLFNKPWKKGPVIGLVVPERRKREEPDNTPLEGQLSIDGLT